VSAGDWAGRKADMHRALLELHKLPDSPTGKGAQVPFPYVDRKTYEKSLDNKQLNEAIRRAPVKTISLEGLSSIQHSVNRDRVAQYLRDPHMVPAGMQNSKSHTPIDYPVVVQTGKGEILHDGNHRLTAEWCKGKRRAEVRLVDLG
jgi:hypothetical protein